MEPSQIGQMKDDLTRERGAGGEKRSTDRAAGVAHRLDAKERTSLWNIDHEMAEWLRCGEVELQAATRPGDLCVSIPTIEAIVENDLADWARDRKAPSRWHGDVLEGQNIGIRPPGT